MAFSGISIEIATRERVNPRKRKTRTKRRSHTRKQRGGISANSIPFEVFYFKIDVFNQNGEILEPNTMNPILSQAILEQFQNEKAPIGEIGQQFFDVSYSYVGDNGVYSVNFKDRYHNIPVGLVPQCNGFR